MREPVIGNLENGYDNTVYKHIDIMEDDGETVANTIAATEWFAEACFAGWWRVNPDWLAAQVPPEQEPGGETPADPPQEEPAPTGE